MPLNSPNPPISLRRHLRKQRRAQINIPILATSACIHYLSLRSRTRSLVDKGDGLPAFRVEVRIHGVRHHVNGKSDDVFAVGIGGAAGAEADVPVGYFAGEGTRGGRCCAGGGVGGRCYRCDWGRGCGGGCFYPGRCRVCFPVACWVWSCGDAGGEAERDGEDGGFGEASHFVTM